LAETVSRAERLDSEPPNEEARSLRELITPAEDRFVRCNFPIPQLDEQHPVEIAGAVFAGRAFVQNDLRAMPHVSLTVTTECAGNGRTSMQPQPPGQPWGNGAVSTAQWTGVPLRELVQPRESAVELVFTGADGGEYRRSLPVEVAMDPAVIVAFEMNGAPIPAKFGGPLRLIVPGWYGMASVKWLARVEAVERPFEGEFQTKKYIYEPGVPVTTIRPKSMFTGLPRSLRAGQMTIVGGFAWSGDGVRLVQVSLGGVWRGARLVGPPLPHAWRRFEVRWTPQRAGSYKLRCRAFGNSGVQPDRPEWNEQGYGANGVEEIIVEVL
jgi:DMSO/TMAO reductase YedYZ molybdopterin-dependent catalytic subunit